MEFPDFAPPRVVTHTYKRKRGRGPRFQQHSLAPSPLRNGMSINQYGSDEDESSSKESSAHKATPPPPPTLQRMLQTTPPSTPPRKRKGTSQASSPAKSSSSSPSKVSIDRELGRIFSPKSSKSMLDKDNISAIEEEDEEPSTSATVRDALLQSPRKPSFADRMAPRRSRKKDESLVEEDQDTSTVEVDSDSQVSEVQSSQSSSLEDDSTVTMAPILLHAPSERVYGRVRSFPEPSTSQPTKILPDDLKESKPCLKELSRRWEELDDLDEEDEEPAVNSITDLRARGQSRRFREDFQYLVLDLRPSQSLADRRSTCVEIAKKALTWADEDKEIYSEQEADRGNLLEETTLTPFLSQVKAADLTGQLWSQLRHAGAGNGTDKVLDSALLLVCLKAARCDFALSMSLSSQDDFNSSLAVMLASSSSVSASGKDVARHQSTLIQLANSSHLCSSDEGLHVPILVLQVLSALVDIAGQSNSKVPIDIAQIDSQTDSSIVGQLWHQIAQRAALVNKQHSPDHHSLSLIAQVIVGCIGQVGTSVHLDTSPVDLVTLVRYYCRLGLLEDEEGPLDTLCSLLRMTVALMSLDGCTWDTDLMQADGLLDCIVQLTVKGATRLTLTQQRQDDNNTRVEPFTLSLALLTDFLVKDPLCTRRFLLNTEQEEQVALLAHLLKQQRREAEVDADSGYLTGSLAVILALLIVESEADSSETAKGTCSKEETLALQQIKRGLQCSTMQASILVIRDSLVDFADMVQMAARTQQVMLQTASRAKDEEDFFAGLLKSLAVLLESHSPSQQEEE